MTGIQQHQALPTPHSFSNSLLWKIAAAPVLLCLVGCLVMSVGYIPGLVLIGLAGLSTLPVVVVIHILFAVQLLRGRLSITRPEVIAAVVLVGLDLLLYKLLTSFWWGFC